MAKYLLDPVISGSDWSFSYTLGTGILVNDTWGLNDVVVVAVTPDFRTWDDYGMRSSSFPYSGGEPALSASSIDLTGRVTLIAPRTVLIKLPAADTRRLGAGTMNLGAAVENLPLGSRFVFLSGRLPIEYGVV